MFWSSSSLYTSQFKEFCQTPPLWGRSPYNIQHGESKLKPQTYLGLDMFSLLFFPCSQFTFWEQGLIQIAGKRNLIPRNVARAPHFEEKPPFHVPSAVERHRLARLWRQRQAATLDREGPQRAEAAKWGAVGEKARRRDGGRFCLARRFWGRAKARFRGFVLFFFC